LFLVSANRTDKEPMKIEKAGNERQPNDKENSSSHADNQLLQAAEIGC
jgi:hypothetical protein